MTLDILKSTSLFTAEFVPRILERSAEGAMETSGITTHETHFKYNAHGATQDVDTIQNGFSVNSDHCCLR